MLPQKNWIVRGAGIVGKENYQELITSHLKFSEGVARKFYREYQHSQLEFDDIRSAAYYGLCRAASRYEESRGVSFRAYSYMRIRGAMYDLLRCDISPFSSRRAVEEARVSNDNFNQKQQTSSLQSLQIAISRTIDELGVCFSGESIENQLELTYLDDCSPEESSTKVAFRQFVSSHLDKLPEKEREVVKRRYFYDQSFPEIAPHLNDVRTSWLCRIHTRALDRLRSMMIEGDAQEWLQEVA